MYVCVCVSVCDVCVWCRMFKMVALAYKSLTEVGFFVCVFCFKVVTTRFFVSRAEEVRVCVCVCDRRLTSEGVN